MKHDYSPQEILYAWNHRDYKAGQNRTEEKLRAFIDALPERPQAQPGPWPGQQKAIDAAMIEAARSNDVYGRILVADPTRWSKYWPKEAPARLAIAQAYDKARPQAAEIASLKAEREKWEADALRYCKNADFWRSEHDKAQDELSALRQSTQSAQPLLADDGRSLDQVYQDTYNYHLAGNGLDGCCDAGVQSVAAVVLAQAVRRMEAVPVEELLNILAEARGDGLYSLDAVRARLIAAAKGEGQAVVVNEPPKDEPSQAQQAKAQPWTPAVGDTVRLKSGGPVMTVTAINTNGLCAVTAAVGQWFAGKTVMGKSFPAACLTPAQP